MNYQSLQYFVVLARHEHYTQAAKELFITQSALSKSIAGLEEELGVPLFEKDGRNIRLTKYGRILFDYVDRGISELDSGVERIKELNCPTKGKIKLSISSYPGSDEIPDLLQGFAFAYPDIGFKIYQSDARSISEKLCSGAVDLGICGELIDSDENSPLIQVELYSHELGLIVSDSSPYANMGFVNFADIAEETFIGYNDDVSITKTILDAVAPTGYTPKINYYISDGYLISGLVRANLGIGIVPIESHVHFAGTQLVRIKQPYIEQRYYLTWNKARFLPSAAETFKNYALSKLWQSRR